MIAKRIITVVLVWLLCFTEAFAASEIQYMQNSLTTQTLYAKVRAGAGHASVGQYWNGSAWTTLTTAAGDFDIAMTEVSTTGFFTGTMPASATGNVVIEVWQDADDNGTPVHASDLLLAESYGFWDGTRLGESVAAWRSTAVVTPTVEGVPEVDITHVAGQLANAVSGNIDANVAAISGGTTAADNAELYFDGTGYKDTDNLYVVRASQATAATSTTITLDSGASTTADLYNYGLIQIVGDTGVGQSRHITDYSAARVATVSPAWTTTPDATSDFIIWPAAMVQATGATGGPIEQREVAPARRLQARSRGDGSFGVIGRVRMTPGETTLWSVDLRGTQVPVNNNLHGMSAPTFTGAQAAQMTLVDYGVDDTEAKFEIALSGAATSSSVINVVVTIQPTANETIIVTVPVTVGP